MERSNIEIRFAIGPENILLAGVCMQFEKIFVKRSNIEIRFAIGPENIPLAGVCMQFGKIFVKRNNIEIRFAIEPGNIPLADVLYAIFSPEIVQAGAVKGLVVCMVSAGGSKATLNFELE